MLRALTVHVCARWIVGFISPPLTRVEINFAQNNQAVEYRRLARRHPTTQSEDESLTLRAWHDIMHWMSARQLKPRGVKRQWPCVSIQHFSHITSRQRWQGLSPFGIILNRPAVKCRQTRLYCVTSNNAVMFKCKKRAASCGRQLH